MAQLYFKYGAMGSSKTANALMARFNYEERGQKTLLCKPQLDTRDGDHMVHSRIGLEYPCVYFHEMREMDEGKLKDLKIVLEMYARGYDFVPIDIYKAKADRFQIIDGKIMPSFASIEGMGEKAAQQLYDAAQKGPFLSKEEINERAKIGKGTIEKMSELGILDGMPETNQLSLFDFM